jgi:hypothetical protein
MTKESIATLSLYNRRKRKFEHATLYRGFDDRNKEHIDEHWMPELRAIRKAQRTEVVEHVRDEVRDSHWEWSNKLKEARKDGLISDVFVIEAGDMTQAAMIVRKGSVKYLSLHSEHPGRPLVYVDYVATAPWNRRVVDDPIYKGCGIMMLGTAISLSINEGYGGRIALKSLRGAESFYRERVGMTEVVEGIDEDGLKYFELPVSQARSVLGRVRAVQGA